MFTAVLFIPTENRREKGTGRENNLPPSDPGPCTSRTEHFAAGNSQVSGACWVGRKCVRSDVREKSGQNLQGTFVNYILNL